MFDIKQVKMLSKYIGEEDRAMLRSNPSAYTDAGALLGKSRLETPQTLNLCIGRKAINLMLQRSIPSPIPSFPPTGVTYVNIFRARGFFVRILPYVKT